MYAIEQDAGNPAEITGLESSIYIDVAGDPDEEGRIQGAKDLSFSGAQFTALGDYKVKIREVSSTNAVSYPVDTSHEYYAYISVRNELDNNNEPTGRYIATLAAQVRDHDTGDKTDAVFSSQAQRSYISIKNEVSGNLANTDDYFKYELNMRGGTNGDLYTVSGQDSVVNYAGETITTSDKVEVGKVNYIYLKHGQTVTIGKDGDLYELPIGLIYNLIEVDANGYTQYVDGVAGDTSEEKTVALDAADAQNKVEYLNHKEGDILTGIVSMVWPYALAVGVTGGLIAAKIIKKDGRKRRKTECSK